MSITNTTSATNTSSGALQVAGGVGIGGKIWAEQLRQTLAEVAIGPGAGATTIASADYVSGGVVTTTLVVDLTTNIYPGMIITGTGFTSGQQVVSVINGTDLEIDVVADSTPSGALDFTGTQGDYAVAIGQGAGNDTQRDYAVAVGISAGLAGQGASAVAIGDTAGETSQGTSAVAIGPSAGASTQGASAVAIGNGAGNATQGVAAIAIGAYAGVSNQPANSIIINATNNNLNGVNTGTYIAPIRADATTSATSFAIFYNPTTNELTTATALTNILTLTVSASAPIGATTGTFAVADRVNWDPASKVTGNAYPVFYDGSIWNSLY